MASRIIEVFQDLEDPRKSNATKHDFTEMLTSGVIAVICGYETCGNTGKPRSALRKRLEW